MPTPPHTPSPTSVTLELDTTPVSEDSGAEADRLHQYELLICAMHFLGDGMALHQFANDFFGLLGGDKSDDELRDMLHEEWRVRWGDEAEEVSSDRNHLHTERELTMTQHSASSHLLSKITCRCLPHRSAALRPRWTSRCPSRSLLVVRPSPGKNTLSGSRSCPPCPAPRIELRPSSRSARRTGSPSRRLSSLYAMLPGRGSPQSSLNCPCTRCRVVAV